jgi:hypothetical protein
MSLMTIAARTVSGGLTTTRVVLTTALDILPPPLSDPLRDAVTRADASARRITGQVLGDQEVTSSSGKPEGKTTAKPAAKGKARPKPAAKTKPAANKRTKRRVRQARPGEAVSGFPEPPGKDPGKISGDAEPHHSLSNPVGDPDPTEWPDPYERREDPRDPPDPDDAPFGDEPHPVPGSMSTSEPHPADDPEAGDRQQAPERDALDS